MFDIRIYSGEEIDYLKILPSTIRSLSMSIWIQQCKSQISSSYHIRITFISHSYHIHITFISHSSYFGVTSHHPRWPNVLFQQGTSEWQPVKKTGKGWERYRKVPRCCVFVGFVTGLLLKIPDVYYIILCIYTLWLLATSTFVKLLKGHCSRQILVSIWMSKNPFLLHVVWTQKCIQVRIGPFSLCKSCT